MIEATRTCTPVDAVADAHLHGELELNPITATSLGVPGADDRLPPLTPDWYEQVSAHRRATLTALRAAVPIDANDRVTVAALAEELGSAEALRATGHDEALLSNIESPVQFVRVVFDLAPTATPDNWADVATRLAAVPAALEGYVESLRFAAARGHVAAVRQVEACAEQCLANVGPDGFFAGFVGDAALPDGGALSAGLRADLARGAAAASAGYERLAAFLRDELVGQAPTADAVGREVYPLHLRRFLGTDVDLAETYAWGQQELDRIRHEQAATANRIRPGASVSQAVAALDADPARVLHGTAALRAWMQDASDAALDALADTHFDIPAEIRTLECRIAPTSTGGVYYTGPSEDLVSRPGRMWWAVPVGETSFTTWRERSTVYHEGVPGHHLQIAQTAYRAQLLNRWRRLASWVSGHGEGWALYAERLMAELGFLDDPADYLGMLANQAMRAARVVIDIGLHCGLPAPAEAGGGAWTYDKACAFLAAHSSLSAPAVAYEVTRYCGWPGQAPSYKLGERIWLALRDDVHAAQGSAFDLRTFHRDALDLGSVGLDVLRAAVLGTI